MSVHRLTSEEHPCVKEKPRFDELRVAIARGLTPAVFIAPPPPPPPGLLPLSAYFIYRTHRHADT